MARSQANKLYRTFTKGLITEAGFLTFPENASIDELNTIIHRKGNRTRRPGIDPAFDGDFSFVGYSSNELTTEFLWKSAANKPDINFLCIQTALMIDIYSMRKDQSPLRNHRLRIDLGNFASPTATAQNVDRSHAHMASGKGYLFIAHPFADPITVEYLPDTDSFSVVRVVLQVRDFDGVNDGFPNDFEPADPTNEHLYNLRNQGWTGGTPTYVPGETVPPDQGGDGNGGVYYNPWDGTQQERRPDDGNPIP